MTAPNHNNDNCHVPFCEQCLANIKAMADQGRRLKTAPNQSKDCSDCHRATVTIGGDDREGTHYYVCSECNEPCDLAVMNQSASDQGVTPIPGTFIDHPGGTSTFVPDVSNSDQLDDLIWGVWADGSYTGNPYKSHAPIAPEAARESLTKYIQQECEKSRLRGIEEVLLRLKQAPPVDWIDAQTWIDSEYNRLKEIQGSSTELKTVMPFSENCNTDLKENTQPSVPPQPAAGLETE